MPQWHFSFRTRVEAAHIARVAAEFFSPASTLLLGLHELTLNAVEHGNLGFGFEEKQQLIAEQAWDAALESRLQSSGYGHRVATLTVERSSTHAFFTILDQGEGFDWRPYLLMDLCDKTSLNGRGIATARALSFPDLEYLGCGNQVRGSLCL